MHDSPHTSTRDPGVDFERAWRSWSARRALSRDQIALLCANPTSGDAIRRRLKAIGAKPIGKSGNALLYSYEDYSRVDVSLELDEPTAAAS